MAKVRPATDADLDDMIVLARAMHAESTRYNRYPLDEDMLVQVVQAVMAAPEGCVLVVEREGLTVGMLWAHLSTMFFSRVRIAQDILFYITPEHRRGWYARGLVQAYEQWARDHRVTEIHLAVSAGIDNPRAIRFCEGLGYAATGSTLTKTLGGDDV